MLAGRPLRKRMRGSESRTNIKTSYMGTYFDNHQSGD